MRMTAWRTNPDLPLSSARDLAEKYKDLGWRRLFKSEQRRIRKDPHAVCEHLDPQHIQSLAAILKIPPPVRRSQKPLPSRGKDALMERIRAAHRVFRDDAKSEHHKLTRAFPKEHKEGGNRIILIPTRSASTPISRRRAHLPTRLDQLESF